MQADLVTSTFPDESPVVKRYRHQENLKEWPQMTATYFGQNEKVFFFLQNAMNRTSLTVLSYHCTWCHFLFNEEQLFSKVGP